MKTTRFIIALLLVLATIASVAPSVQAAPAPPPGNWRSGIACQNLDTSNDANVSLVFYPEGSGTSAITYTSTIISWPKQKLVDNLGCINARFSI